MAQLAARAGVCKATISLALRNDPRIPPETTRRIQNLAHELGYTRNPVLDDLMTQLRQSRVVGHQRTIGLLNAFPARDAFTTHRTIPVWVAGCRRRANYLGYTTDDFWLHDPNLDAPRLRRILETRAIRGVVVIGAFGTGSIPEKYMDLWNNFACVVTGVRTHNPPLSFTCVDHHNLVLDAVRAVRRLGYRRPGLVIADDVDRATDARLSCAMWLAQKDLPVQDQVEPFTQFVATAVTCAPFGDWFRKERPDVILTLHPAALDWLRDLGLQVPQDVGLVHLERNTATSTWAAMNQHNDVAGEAAVDMLSSMLQSREFGVPDFPRATLIGASWSMGTTVRPQPAREGRKVSAGHRKMAVGHSG